MNAPIIHVVLNHGSGSSDAGALAERIEAVATSAGRRAEIHRCEDGAAIERALDQATHGTRASRDAGDSPDAADVSDAVVVAGGGDGTVNAVASRLAGTGGTLGVLPLGTLNHFAKDVGIPQDLDGAMATILAGHVIRVDVGEVNGHVFVNNSSVGLYPRLVELRNRYQSRGIAKWAIAAWATTRVLRTHRDYDLRVCLEGEELHRRTPLVFIGNNRYEMSGLDAGKRETLTDGQLSLYIVRERGAMALLRLMARIVGGTATETHSLDELQMQSARIETDRAELKVAVDGEVLRLGTPLTYRIRPRSLAVFTPAPSASS